MKLRRTIGFLALLALLCMVLTPLSGAAWQCEGQTCGTTPWICCCDSPVEAPGDACGSLTRHGGGVSDCQTDCGCLLVLQDLPTLCRSAASSYTHFGFAPALVPQTAAIALLLPSETPIRSIETRGPPPSRSSWLTPSLRAPPAA